MYFKVFDKDKLKWWVHQLPYLKINIPKIQHIAEVIYF